MAVSAEQIDRRYAGWQSPKKQREVIPSIPKIQIEQPARIGAWQLNSAETTWLRSYNPAKKTARAIEFLRDTHETRPVVFNAKTAETEDLPKSAGSAAEDEAIQARLAAKQAAINALDHFDEPLPGPSRIDNKLINFIKGLLSVDHSTALDAQTGEPEKLVMLDNAYAVPVETTSPVLAPTQTIFEPVSSFPVLEEILLERTV